MMKDINITEKEAERIYNKIASLEINIKKQQQYLKSEDIFFDNQEFMLLMNISKRTSQIWRDTGVIGFSQVNNKIYFRLSDIQLLLEKNYKPAYKK